MAHVFVGDQDKAHRFSTDILGFQTKDDFPLGSDRWPTVVSPQDPEPELLLEPAGHPAVRSFRQALVTDGIPAASFAVADTSAEVEQLSALGVTFAEEPFNMRPVTTAVFDGTCSNLIQLATQH